MRKKSDTRSAVAGLRAGAATKLGARRTGARGMHDGGHAVPGKVPRGSVHFLQAGGFSGLGRVILDKLDRGFTRCAVQSQAELPHSLAQGPQHL